MHIEAILGIPWNLFIHLTLSSIFGCDFLATCMSLGLCIVSETIENESNIRCIHKFREIRPQNNQILEPGQSPGEQAGCWSRWEEPG